MNYLWRSPGTGRSAYVDSPSAPAPFPFRSSLQDAIRPGTVASRIESLQKPASPSSPRSHPPPISIPRGEGTRTGFGRRINHRFGKPALQNTNPDEEPHMEAACHFFLGLNAPRVNHVEQYAIAGQRTKYSRSPGINGQIVPDGWTVRTQHDAVAPWGVLSRSYRTRSMGRHVTDLENNIQTESNFFRRQGRLTSEIESRFRLDEESRYLDLYRRNIESRPDYDAMNSEVSNATDSTIRRQSVRDLFQGFGIERPAGLASRETSYEKSDLPIPVRRGKQCHICSKMNPSVSIACSRCKHKPFRECDVSREKETLDNTVQEQRKEKMASKENRSAYRALHKNHLKPAGPPNQVPLSTQETPKQSLKVPNVQLVDLFVTLKNLKKSSRTLKGDKFSPDEPCTNPFLAGPQVPRRVKDSPFLIADLLALNCSIPLRPVEDPAKNGPSLGNSQNHRLERLENKQEISSTSNGCKCSSSTCRATHQGHQPYRHTVSCIKKKRDHYVLKDTDKGYSADTSRVEVATQLHSKSSQTKEQRVNRYSQRTEPKPSPSHYSKPSAMNSQVGNEQERLEFVECHGYPRTGHSRLGSPVSSGVVGQCQHCLYDCQCEACKSTHHNVRCCVHDDHQTRAHRHLTPKKGASLVSEKDSTTNTTKGSNKMESSKSTVVIPPNSDQNVPRNTAKPLTETARQAQPSEKPTHIKMPSLPRSNRFSLMTEKISKPPTPPPWIFGSRKGSLAGIAVAELRGETRREGAGRVLSMKAPEDPPPSLKEESKIPSVVRRSNVALAALRYLYENDEKRRESLRRPSMRSIIENLSRPPSTRPPSSMQVSRPGSRRASQRLSALFQLREQNPVPLLNQKLLKHQEELKRAQIETYDKSKIVAKDSMEEFTCDHERQEPTRTERPGGGHRAEIVSNSKLEKKERGDTVRNGRLEKKETAGPAQEKKPEQKGTTESLKSNKTDAARNKSWRIRLVDRRPSPACVNDAAVQQHRLAEDEVVTTSRGRTSLVSQLPKGTELTPPECDDRERVWKSRLLEQESRGLRILGITVLLHLEKREDVVFKAVDWMGGELRAGN